MAKKNVDDDFSDSFDIDLSVNSRKKSYSLSEFELTEIAMANESRNIIDHIYNILSGNSPLNSIYLLFFCFYVLDFDLTIR